MEAADELLEALTQAGAPITAYQAPGLSTRAIDAKLNGASIALPGEVRDYFGWGNGLRSDRDADYELFPGGSVLSLDEAIAAYRQSLELAARLAQSSGLNASFFWDARWFPLFHDGAGDYHVTLAGAPSPPTAPLYLVVKDDREATTIAYDSLTALLRTVAACFQAGAYRIIDGVIAEDRARSAEIVRAHNPERLRQAVGWLRPTP
jgi:cell wall assembly regulator SMI1